MQRCAFQTGFMGASGFSSARWNCRMSDRWIQWYGSNMRPTSFLVFRFWNSLKGLDVFSTKPRETIQLGDPHGQKPWLCRSTKRLVDDPNAIHGHTKALYIHCTAARPSGNPGGQSLGLRRDGPWSEARLVQVKPVKPCEALRLP